MKTSWSEAYRSLLGGVVHRIRRLTDQLAEVHFLDLAGSLALTLSRLANEAAPACPRMSCSPGR